MSSQGQTRGFNASVMLEIDWNNQTVTEMMMIMLFTDEGVQAR